MHTQPDFFDLASVFDEYACLSVALLEDPANGAVGGAQVCASVRSRLKRAIAMASAAGVRACCYARFHLVSAPHHTFYDHVRSRAIRSLSAPALHLERTNVRASCLLQLEVVNSTGVHLPISVYGIVAFAAAHDCAASHLSLNSLACYSVGTSMQAAAILATPFVEAILHRRHANVSSSLHLPHNVIIALALNDWAALSEFFGLPFAHSVPGRFGYVEALMRADRRGQHVRDSRDRSANAHLFADDARMETDTADHTTDAHSIRPGEDDPMPCNPADGTTVADNDDGESAPADFLQRALSSVAIKLMLHTSAKVRRLNPAATCAECD